MPIKISDNHGIAEMTITGQLGPGDAKEVRLYETPSGWIADLAGVQTPVPPALAEQLRAAGARDAD